MKLIVLIVALATTWAVVLYIFFKDQDLNPSIENIIQSPIDTIPDDQNAYLAILGVEYQADYPPHVIGRHLVSLYNNKTADERKISSPTLLLAEYEKIELKLRLENDHDICFVPREKSCNKFCCWPEEKIESVWGQNIFLLNKLNTILEYSEYQYLGRRIPYSTLLNIGKVAELNSIYLSQIGKDEEALTSIINSIKLWRTMLDNPTTQLTSLTLYINLQRSLETLSFLLQKVHLTDRSQKIEKLLRPYSAESALTNVMKGELIYHSIFKEHPSYVYSQGLIDENLQIEKKKDRISEKLVKNLIFKPNATLNNLYKQYKNAIHRYKNACDERMPEDFSLYTRHFYNKIGEIMTKGQPSDGAIRSMFRINAHLQTARAIYELKLANTKPVNFTELIKKIDVLDEYSGIQTVWDRENYRIGVKLGKLESCDTWFYIYQWGNLINVEGY